MNLSDTYSICMVINSEESAIAHDSEDDFSTVKPYQFESNAEEMLDSSSEGLLSEGETMKD